jgi:hypothetical protein
MSKRFFKTIFTYEVLTEDVSIEYDDINSVVYECRQGDAVGTITNVETEELSAEEMAKALSEAGSEPAFFELE